jgi:hypothetical protein
MSRRSESRPLTDDDKLMAFRDATYSFAQWRAEDIKRGQGGRGEDAEREPWQSREGAVL